MSDVVDEAVGYRRPPRKSQFQKGRSGNPKGRPPKPKPQRVDVSMAAILERAGKETVVVNGEEMTLRDLEIRSIQRKAARGDVTASRYLSKLREDAGIGATPAQTGGVLVVPAPMNFNEWSAASAIQQAKFREPDYGK